MTWDRSASGFLILGTCFCFLLLPSTAAKAKEGFTVMPPMKKALLVIKERSGEPTDFSAIGRLILGTLAKELAVVSFEDYSPSQSESQGLTLFMAPHREPYAVELPREGIPFIWLGPGMPSPNPYPEGLAYAPFPTAWSFSHMRYKDKTVSLGKHQTMSKVHILAPHAFRVIAEGTDLENSLPYIFQVVGQSQWFVTTLPYWGELSIPFNTIIGSFFSATQREDLSLFVRLDGVTPFTSPKALKALCDTLKAYKVPFGVAFQPRATEARGGREIFLSVRKELATLLREAARNGALLILDHNFGGIEEKTPPLPRQELAYRSFENDLALCSNAKVIPGAIQGTNYRVSPEALSQLRKFFTLFLGQVQVGSGDQHPTFMIPFISKVGSMTYVPETLGYIRKEDPQGSSAELLARAQALSQVPGSIASFGYDLGLGAKALMVLLRSLKEMGYGEVLSLGKAPETLWEKAPKKKGQKINTLGEWSRFLGTFFMIAGFVFVVGGLGLYLGSSRKHRRDLFR